MELNQTRIEDGVIQEVADRLIDENKLSALVRTMVEDRVNTHFKNVADKQIQDVINESIQQGFDKVYMKVNTYGEVASPPTTIRKELEKLVEGYWNEKVGRDGKATTSSYNDKWTRAEWVMMQIVSDKFTEDMKQHTVNIAGALKDGLRKELQLTVNRLLSEVFHVTTADDKLKPMIY